MTASAPMGSSEASICSHCALGVGPTPVADEQGLYCCTGCQTVYHAINSCGLQAYYAQREGPGAKVEKLGRDFALFDDPTFLARHARQVERSTLRRIELHIEGLHCSACVWLVEKLSSLEPGVISAQLSYADARLELIWDPDQVALSQVALRLERLGYPPFAAAGVSQREHQRATERRLLAKIGVAGAAFGNVMLLGFALYSGDSGGMSNEDAQFFRWASLIVTLPAVLFTASGFFRGAWAAVVTRTAHMDLPISIGVLAALISGSVNTVRGQGEIYFDSVTMLVFFLLVGRWLQARQLRRARRVTDLMLSLAPSTSRLISADGVTEVPTESVVSGALVEVRSGEQIGVDGLIEEGTSAVDASLLTGEAEPVRVSVGSEVHAGTVNVSSRLVIRVRCSGRETRLAAIVKEVERAARSKAPIVEFADRISAYFVGVVLTLAAMAAWLAWPLGADIAVDRAVAVLIVTCPCALGLATPLVGSVALAQAARLGILVKGARYLELLSKPGLFVFDKTGTLTCGRLTVVEWYGNEETIDAVLAAEASSAHPIAQALRRRFPERTVAVSPTVLTQERLGLGVVSIVDGQRIAVGNRRLLAAEGVVVGAEVCCREQMLLERGLSPVFVAINGVACGIAALGDPLRAEAKDCLEALLVRGHRLALLSGDNQVVVARVARELGVAFHLVLGEQSPEQKLAFVQAQAKVGAVFMVGDGVNDAAALSAASVGIAVAGGAEASLAAADIFTTRQGLTPLVELLDGSERVMRAIYRNLAVSIGYNALAASLALVGWIQPLIAAILMPISSLTVVIGTLRSRSFTSESVKGQDGLPRTSPNPVPAELTAFERSDSSVGSSQLQAMGKAVV